jgi:hypothetical protein
MMLHLAVGAAALLVVAICLLFVLNSHYHAGLIGNVGLCLIALVGLSRVGDIVEHGLDARISPQGALLWIGLALFLGRQAWRFMSRLHCAVDWYPARGLRRRCDVAANEAAVEPERAA